MKFLVLTAIIAAVSTHQLSGKQQAQGQSPWQVGKLYRYDVAARTLARLQEGASSGSAFRARFIVRSPAPGHLQAKLENPQHAQVHQQLPNNRNLPEDLKWEPVPNLDKPFDITFEGGRVVSFNVPSAMSLAHENLLKGLMSALQVDLSTYRNIPGAQNYYDKESHQGQFRKMETDVTGDSETLYVVSPVASEWRRELPNFTSDEDPIKITKTKNYGHAHHRVAYHFGVPEGAEWTGTAHNPREDQFISGVTVSRILASKQGQIYKAESTSTVYVHPHLYGKQKAEVYSNVQLYLVSSEQDNESQWEKSENSRLIKSLLYSMSTKQNAYYDHSSASSEVSNEQNQLQTPKNRVRRLAPKIAGVKNTIANRKQHSSSSSSSSSDSSSAYVNDKIPETNEPAYAALYMSPQSHAVNKQSTMNVQKLLQDIAQQLQNPNNMPKADFLSKFNILVRVIAGMSTEQLAQTSRSIEVVKSSNNVIKADMWMIYRDAVAQAGTLPAFQQIKTWILTMKLQGEEAAQVVATLANTLRYPTKEAMTQFFKLAVSNEVSQQRFLNTSALIAATRFINKGQVNNETAHAYYPSHMYGRLARKYDTFVLDEILPHLSQKLEQYIKEGDSGKAQVYIRAIGNLGHSEILKVFAPYLEGKIPTSTYLRTQIVNSLVVLAAQEDKKARTVLYSILENAAEHYEVRVEAISKIMRARPTSAMMQYMAAMTHNDPSLQVRAALKSAIESAAQLKHPRYMKLARTADVARPMLTKEKFGYQQSFSNLNDNYDSENQQNLFRSLFYIGSEDSIYPKSLLYNWRTKYSGLEYNKIRASVSSVQQLVEFLTEAVTGSRSQSNHKYSAEKIAQMLNIQRNPEQPLEASIYIDLINQQRLFTFDEHDLQQLPLDINQYLSQLGQGFEKHYTKVLNQAQVSIMFPLATGMPFIYKYKEPMVIHIQAKAKGSINMLRQPLQASLDKEIQFTYARNIDGSVGFMDTLSNQYSSVGVVNKIQLNVPVKLNIQLKQESLQLRIQPLRPEMDTTLVHYSVWPYSASQKKDSLVTISQDKTTNIIKRSRQVYSADQKFGQKVGMLFQLQGYSHSHDFMNMQTPFASKDMLTTIVYILDQRDVALTHFNLKHLAKQSQNKAVIINVAYDSVVNQQEAGQINEASDVQDVTPNSKARRQELMKRAASGINTAEVKVVDVSAIFEGAQKTEYLLTAAVSASPVDPKIQIAAFFGVNSPRGNNQVNALFKIQKPEITSLNFLQALQKELKASITSDIKFGQNGRIQIQAQAQRSQKYTQDLQASPAAKQSAVEIAQNNLYQDASRKMIVMAHTPDTLEAKITYKNVDQQYKNMSYHLYEMVQHLGYWNSEVNPLKVNPEGSVQIKANAIYSQGILDWSMTSKYGHIQMNNVPIPKSSARVLSFYQPMGVLDRVLNYYTREQYQPSSTVDGSKIRTFSNRSYDYTLSPAWHVVMMDQAQPQSGNLQDLVILARRPSVNQLNIYISYKTETGKDLEINITPEGEQPKVDVQTNGQKLSDGKLKIYWDEVADRSLLQYYTENDGVLVLSVGSEHRILYDGQRLVVFSNDHRSSTWGIAGRMSGEPRDDFQTPWGLVDQPQLYGASFALNDEQIDPQTKQYQNQAKQQAYQRQNKYTTIMRADNQWQQNMEAAQQEWNNQGVYRLNQKQQY